MKKFLFLTTVVALTAGSAWATSKEEEAFETKLFKPLPHTDKDYIAYINKNADKSAQSLITIYNGILKTHFSQIEKDYKPKYTTAQQNLKFELEALPEELWQKILDLMGEAQLIVPSGEATLSAWKKITFDMQTRFKDDFDKVKKSTTAKAKADAITNYVQTLQELDQAYKALIKNKKNEFRCATEILERAKGEITSFKDEEKLINTAAKKNEQDIITAEKKDKKAKLQKLKDETDKKLKALEEKYLKRLDVYLVKAKSDLTPKKK